MACMLYYKIKTSARCCPRWTRFKKTKYYVDKRYFSGLWPGDFREGFVTGDILLKHHSCFDLPLDKKWPFIINKRVWKSFQIPVPYVIPIFLKNQQTICDKAGCKFPYPKSWSHSGGGAGGRLICAFHAFI